MVEVLVLNMLTVLPDVGQWNKAFAVMKVFDFAHMFHFARPTRLSKSGSSVLMFHIMGLNHIMWPHCLFVMCCKLPFMK